MGGGGGLEGTGFLRISLSGFSSGYKQTELFSNHFLLMLNFIVAFSTTFCSQEGLLVYGNF